MWLFVSVDLDGLSAAVQRAQDLVAEASGVRLTGPTWR